ncbi:MAG: hypothetical protein EPN37_11875 [Chitinophagaceae bacterium]|nr:MAG: hypothetical protein EPN37_11875 [Chitinophagaceae bacterium]
MSFRLIQSNESIEAVTKQLLRLLDVQVTNTTLKETLQEHPDYPSLLSISDSLRTWKVDSMGVKVTFEQLLSLPTPFLAHFKSNEIVPVIGINQEEIILLNPAGKQKKLHKEEFLKQWDNVILLAEAPQAPKGGMIGWPENPTIKRNSVKKSCKISVFPERCWSP